MESNTDVAERRCQWCSEPAAESDTHCQACGANLAQREALGELVIPGVTHVDPGLKAWDAQPMRIPGASPTQYVAGPALGAAAMIGGPAALVAVAGLGAVAATEYGTAGRGHHMAPADLDKLGQPSEAALQMLKKLDEEGAVDDGTGTSPAAGTGTPAGPGPATTPGTPTTPATLPGFDPDKPTIL